MLKGWQGCNGQPRRSWCLWSGICGVWALVGRAALNVPGAQPWGRACFFCGTMWLGAQRCWSEGQDPLYPWQHCLLPPPVWCFHDNRVPSSLPQAKEGPSLARSTGAASGPHLGVELWLFFCCPGCQASATPHSDHRPQGAGGEGSGCPLCSSFASVWHSLWGPKLPR